MTVLNCVFNYSLHCIAWERLLRTGKTIIFSSKFWELQLLTLSWTFSWALNYWGDREERGGNSPPPPSPSRYCISSRPWGESLGTIIVIEFITTCLKTIELFFQKYRKIIAPLQLIFSWSKHIFVMVIQIFT